MRGPQLQEILPYVRKLGTDVECKPLSTTDFAINYQNIVCLFGAVLQIHKSDINAVRTSRRLEDNRGLGLATDIDRATHLAVAKEILAVAGIYEDDHGDSTISYKQYDILWNKFNLRMDDPWHWGEDWSFDHELDLLWRSLFSVFAVDDLKRLNHNNLGEDETPEHPPPPLILQALDFLYPLPSYACTCQSRRKNTLQYTTEAGGLSRDGIVAALTESYCPKFFVVYGHTTGDSPQPVIFTVSMSSPLWYTFCNGKTDDFLVDDKHLLIEIAPRARVLQYQPTKSKYKKTTFADLVVFDEAADTISFGSRSGLILNLATDVATLSSAADEEPGHYIEIPAGSHTETPKAVVSSTAWTTTMHITKLEVYKTPNEVDQDLAIKRGIRRSSRLQ
ncbi:hypothetical protein SEUCBS139899_010320 [Sporothrix eucalyptigena]